MGSSLEVHVTTEEKSPSFEYVDVDVVYRRRRMPLCPPPRYNTSK